MPPRPRRLSLWTPRELGGSLALWLDAADQGTYSFATGISQWRDKGPRGAHVTQATGATQPTLVGGALNGLPAVRCASQWLSGSLAIPDANFSVFAVARMQTGAVASGRIIGLAAAGSADSLSGGYTMCRNASTEAIRALILGANRCSIAITYDTPFMYSNSIGVSPGISGWLNGGSQSNGSITPIVATTLLTIGTNISAGAPSTTYWSNDLHEVIVTYPVVSDYIRFRMEGYLAHKWFNGSVLSSDHAWKSTWPS